MNLSNVGQVKSGRPLFWRSLRMIVQILGISLAPGFVSVNVNASAPPQIEFTEPMVVPRQDHTATLLNDGRVLIVGGRDGRGELASAELFDPATQKFTATGSLGEARRNHTATLLPDGRVLIVGGQNNKGALDSAEFFEVAATSVKSKRIPSKMKASRSGHTTTLLGETQVLIAGGDATGTAELFDVGRGAFLGSVSPMTQARKGHAATWLGDDNLFMVGWGGRNAGYFRVAERKFHLWPNKLVEARVGPKVVISTEGRMVLIDGDEKHSIEELDGADGVFRPRLTLGKPVSSAALLANTKVLILGPDLSGLYATKQGVFEELAQTEALRRRGQTATELAGDKRILVVGGIDKDEKLIAAAALFNPASVTTDADEYAGGAIVNIDGRGFLAGEEAEIELARTDGKPFGAKSHWLVLADADGEIHSAWPARDGDCLGATIRVSVSGLTSELKAQAEFRISETAAEPTDSTQSKSNKGVRKNVTINAPSVTVSADKAANATSPAYTALGNIVFTEAVASDFANTGGNKNLKFNAPTGWQFNTSGVTVSFTPNRDISSASVSMTSSQITVTLNVTNTTAMDTLTISGVQVQATDGAAGATSGTITKTSGTATVAGLPNGAVVGTLTQTVGAMSKLVVTLPGQTFTDATTVASSGNSGTVTAQTAGTSFNITQITATDQFFNIITTYAGAKTLSYSGPGGVPSYTTSVNFTSGQSTTTLVTTLTKKETTTITVSDGTITGPASSSLTVNAGAFTKLQLLMPGESADAGTATGQSGSPNAQTAGTAFNVTVNAVDANWNLITSVTHTVGITSSDLNATLPANAALSSGTKTFSVTCKTAGAQTVTATDITDGTKLPDTGTATTINPGTFAKLQLLVPGETASPGSSTGKTGSPSTQTAGIAFNVTVNAVDANWNLVSATDTVGITTTDANDTHPANAALVGGAKSFSVTFKTAGSWTITASDISNGTKTANTSPSISVGAGAFAKLQLLVPGETAAAGTASGKTGTPSAQTAGTPFSVTVNAVDANWNLVSSITDTAGISSSDVNAALPSNAALLAGTKTLSVTLKTAGSRTVTASDVSDGTKISDISPAITVNVGAFAKLQILAPGETASPGSSSGQTGSPTAQTAGTAFTVTVNAVDANWNLVNTNDTVSISSSDPNAALPANAALVGGTKTFSVTCKTAANQTVTATDGTNGAKSPDTTSLITINAGTFTKLQLLVPGETASPGSLNGKTGSPTAQTAGTAFAVTVNAVDANWNVASASDTVSITSTDGNATLPSNAALANGTGTFNVTFKTAGNKMLTASDVTNPAKTANTSPSIAVNPGAFTKLQVLVPGETNAAGTATGKTGTPSAQTAAIAFNVTVNAVDANWNLVNTVTDTVGITSSSDPNAVLPANAALVAGTKTFAGTLKTASSQTVTATDISNGTKAGDTSSAIIVNPGAFAKLQILVPGETASPGSGQGKTGTPSAQVAGTSFNVTINAVDANWNVVNTNDTVAISSTDTNATLSASAALSGGSQTFAVTFRTAGSWTLAGSDVTNPAKTANTSPSITVNSGTFTQLQLIVPGETAAPGTTLGKTGTPSARTAGTSFNVTVNAVDANWNLISTNDTVIISSSDTNATLPSSAALVNGTKSFSLTPKTAGSQTVTATDTSNGAKTPNTSPSIVVNAAAFAKLQLLMPGETSSPGSDTGKTGSPTDQTAGTAFAVTVNAVDAYWNLVSANDTVRITSNDPNASLPSDAALAAGTKSFNITFKTAGSRTVTTTDISNGAKTPDTSPATTVNAGLFTKLQLLVPGELVAPGTGTGKTGSPNAQTTGNAFTITVNAVDANWNWVNTATDTVHLTSSDLLATLPSDAALSSGTKTFRVTLNVVAGTATITASDASDGTKSSDTSPSITVNSAPHITTQPSNQTVCSGSPASFSVTATGSGLTYQWRKGGVNLSNGGHYSGATTATLTINPADAGDAASYYVVVTGNTSPAATSDQANLTITTPPSITATPASQTVCVGSSAAFSVSATGGALSYQWRKDGSLIPGATNSTFTIAATTTSDAGSYDVVVDNVCASPATSAAAALTVNSPPQITDQPDDQTACAGASVSFTLTATGSGLTYQWRKNGSNISGATSATYTINPVGTDDAGPYDVVVSGSCSPARTSSVANLVVNSLPSISVHPASQTVCSGSSVNFSVTASGTGITYQWRKDGSNISGATGSSYSIASAGTGEAGSYDVVVSGACNPPATSSAATLTVNTPPSITVQPLAQTVCAGSSVTFSVTATGSGLSYQWRKNSANIAGATSSTYTINPIGTGNAGSYDVVVTGTCSPPVTSAAASLAVNTAPAITVQPTNQTVCAGGSVTVSVTATGAGLTYQWRKGGSDLAGATGPTLTFNPVTTADAGSYDVVVSGTCSPSATSSAASLTVNTAPSITVHPADRTVCSGATVSFSVTATGTGLTYQWRKNGSNISGATSATYTINPASVSHEGSYDVVVSGACSPAISSNSALLTVNTAPSIAGQPASQSVCLNSPASFSVTATGTDLTYQWRKNGSNLPGATASTYSIASAVSSDAGSYDVVITGTCSPTATSTAATLSVNLPPSVTAQPVAQTVCLGNAVTFSVAVSGAGPMAYQWRKNGDDLNGATGSSFSITSVTAADSGVYDVVVTGACNPPAVSEGATLTVNIPPSIATQPAGQTVCLGLPASLTVAATGSGPLTYQWRKDGVDIAGATAATLNFNAVTLADAGSYDVVISGVCNPSVTSQAATLTVHLPPNITTQSGDQTVCLGSPASFSVTATGTGLVYQWRKNGASISGETSSTLTIASASVSDAGAYDVVVSGSCSPSAVSIPANLTVHTPPDITAPPASQTVCSGASVSLSVTAVGGGLSYQWRRNGVNLTDGGGISGSTTATMSLNPVDSSQAGVFDVVVTGGACGLSAISNGATLVVNLPPSITSQPATQTVCSGASVNLSVEATGAGLTYQWRKDGVNLTDSGSVSGANTPTLTINPSASGDSGTYDVVVSGACNPPVTSNAAILTVPQTPGTAGSISGLTTVCSNTTGVTYSIAPVSGATSYAWAVPAGATLVSGQGTTSITVNWGSTSGDVAVTPSNACLSNTSTTLRVTVLIPPTIVSQPSNQNACPGAVVFFSVSMSSQSGSLTYQWRKNGVNLSNGGNIVGAASATLAITSLTPNDAGSYSVVVNGTCGSGVTSSSATLSVATTPTITAQPTDQTVCLGSAAFFAVTVSGVNPTYQWRKDGNPIAGATNNTLIVSSITAAQAGNYDVVICNACGNSVISNSAVLAVASAPSISIQPTNQVVCLGSPANFAVIASGTGLTYQWRKNGTIIPGATSPTYSISSVTVTDVANYSVVVSGSCSPAVTSASASLSLQATPAFTSQPTNRTACIGSATTFSVSATGSGLSYQWRKNGNAITGATANAYTIASVQSDDAGSYDVVLTDGCHPSLTSATAALVAGVSPNISVSPASQTVCASVPVTFSVSATGTDLAYQWRKNGSAIAGATSPIYGIPSATAANAGTYDVVVSNACASTTSSGASLTVKVPPVIASAPASVAVCDGASAIFSVSVSGQNGPLTYQWRKNGATLADGGNIFGATTVTLVINPVGPSDRDTYDVIVSDECGPIAPSAAAVLTVNTPAAFTQQPVSKTVCSGAPAVFSATAAGGGLTYQWRKNGVNLANGGRTAGATSPQLTIVPADPSDAGSYDLVVTGVCGAPAVSDAATLTVNIPPSITAQPVGTARCLGDEVTLSVAASGTGLTYQWRKNGTPISGATASAYTVSSVAATHAGSYSVTITGACGTALTSSVATLAVNTPVAITAQPVDRAVCVGGETTFAVSASGAGLNYQWRKNGVNLSGGSGISGLGTPTLTISSAVPDHAGTYDVVVSGACGAAVTSTARKLTVNTAPVISVQPADQTACSGNLANFSVTATGSGLTYQWRRNGANLANGRGIGGATTSTLTLQAGSVASGNIDVVVRGSCGSSVTSAAATFTANTTPAITKQPAGQTVCAGATATFSVTATGSGLTYQWLKGGVALADGGRISGATASTLNISFVEAADAGSYSVKVSGACTPAVTSSAVTLAVTKLLGVTGEISGANLVCAGKAGIVYSVAPVAEATTYAWTVPADARITSGQGTKSIIVTWGSTAGAVTVTPSNKCFTGPTRTLSVGVSTLTVTQQPVDQTLLADCTVNVTFTAAATGNPAPTVQWQVSANGGTSWSNLAGKTNSTLVLVGATPAQNGYQYRAMSKSACSTVYSNPAKLTATKIPTVSDLNVTPGNPQYSDPIQLEATLSPAATCGLAPATTVTFYIDSRKLGVVPLVREGAALKGILPAAPILEAPGTRSVKAIFGGVSPFFAVNNATNSLTVAAEDARVFYTGPTNVAADSTGKATVVLKATVQDISAVSGDPAFDSSPGQIRNARVAFVNRTTGTVIGEVAVAASSSDPKTGTATFNWVVNLGTSPSTTFNVGMVVKGYFVRDNPADNRTVTVQKR